MKNKSEAERELAKKLIVKVVDETLTQGLSSVNFSVTGKNMYKDKDMYQDIDLNNYSERNSFGRYRIWRIK